MISLVLVASYHPEAPTFNEKDGLVVIETESTTYSLRKWK